MAKVGGLGKGLDALLGNTIVNDGGVIGSANLSTFHSDSSQVTMLDPHLLDPNPHQPREDFDESALKELSCSIKEHGVVQPIIAERAEGGRYRIVAGERRTRAAIMAGLDRVPVLVRHYDDEKRLEIALIENIQRSDLNPIEEAKAYQKLMELGNLNQDELSHKVGKKRSTVANALRLLNLNSGIKEALQSGKITAGHARALLSCTDDTSRTALFNRIIEDNLTVRQAEALSQNKVPSTRETAAPSRDSGQGNSKTQRARGETLGTQDEGQATRRDADIKAIEQQMLEKFGTKCRINGTLQKGKIEMDYYSKEDLERLCELLV